MPIIRKRLYASEGSNPNTRVNTETGIVETTPDGGTTWQPDPNSDPRTNPAFQLPLVEDNQCPAAAGMVLQMQDFVETVFGKTTLVGIAGAALLMLTLMLPGAGFLFAVATLIGEATITAGAAIIYASFTTPVWEDILCLIVCFTDEDGAFTQSSFDDFIDRVYSDLGDSVGFGVAQMFQAWGVVGFNNAGVLRADAEADCSTCECDWEVMLDFRDEDFAFTDTIAYNGEWVSGEGWRTGSTASWDGANWGYRIYQERDLPFDTQISGFDVFIQPTTNQQMWVELYNDPYTTGGIAWTTTGTDATGHEETSPAFSGSMGVNVRHIRLFSGGFNPQNTFRYLRIRGTGANPFE